MSTGKNEIAYCGLYCPMCSFRVAYETQDRDHFVNLPAQYERRKHMELEPCGGCKAEASLCGECDKRDCATEKGIDTCADCGDFPCAKLDAFAGDGIPHHKESLENLHAIKQMGYDAWLADQNEKSRCQTCGKRQSWYFNCTDHQG